MLGDPAVAVTAAAAAAAPGPALFSPFLFLSQAQDFMFSTNGIILNSIGKSL